MRLHVDILSDQLQQDFMESEWFTRDWTLQELLAPLDLEFHDANWNSLGTRQNRASEVERVTTVPARILVNGFPGPGQPGRPAVAVIMSWASGRTTKRPEDKSYSLLGLFDVHMSLIYGEGKNAFFRLQKAILDTSDHQSILAWHQGSSNVDRSRIFARSTDDFVPLWNAANLQLAPTDRAGRRTPHAADVEGLSIELDLVSIAPRTYVGLVNVPLWAPDADLNNLIVKSKARTGIVVQRIDHEDRYTRVHHELSIRFYNVPDPIEIPPPARYERRLIKLVNSLKLREQVQLFQSPELCSFMVETRIEYTTQLHNQEFYKQEGNVWTLKEDSKPAYGLVGTIKFKEYHVRNPWPSLTEIFYGAHVEILAISFGFDFDYNPIIFIVNYPPVYHPDVEAYAKISQSRLTDAACNDRLSWLLQRTDDDPIYRSNNFKPGGNQTPQTIDGRMRLMMYNGLWRNDVGSYLILKTTTRDRDRCTGFTATLRRHGDAQPDWKVRVSRSSSQEPWQIDIEKLQQPW